jgi:hypothetical protein
VSHQQKNGSDPVLEFQAKKSAAAVLWVKKTGLTRLKFRKDGKNGG